MTTDIVPKNSVWIACPLCGNYRWVRLEKGVPRSKYCRHCCSDEAKAKRIMSLIGRPCLLETRQKLSQAKMGNHNWLGKHHTEETKRKLSLVHIGRKVSNTTKEKLRAINLQRSELRRLLSPPRSSIPIRKGLSRSEATKARWENPDYRAFILSRLHSPASRAKASKNSLGKVVTQQTRDKIRKTLTGSRFSKDRMNNWLAAMQKMLHSRPNKGEQKVAAMLDELRPGEWSHVGDWKFVVAGKCPDFVNVNGKKLIIEVFGDYWHRNDSPEKRASLFAEFGYKTLVIWEHELKDEVTLSDKIKEFVG